MKHMEFHVGRKTPRVFSWLILIVVGLVGIGLFWSHKTILPEIVRAPGQIGPVGQLHEVGHYDGGMVSEIKVRPGDTVAEGDVIAIVRKPDIDSEITRIEQQIAVLQRDEHRLSIMRDFLRKESPSASDVRHISMAWEEDASIAQNYQIDQIETYLARRETLVARSIRARENLSAAKQFRSRLTSRIDHLQKREQRSLDLFQQGLTTVAQVERETDGLEQLRSEALQADIRVLEAKNEHSETEVAINTARIDIQTRIQDELYQTRVELERLQTELVLLLDSLARSSVAAPAKGTVQSVNFSAYGEIVSPGQTIATILPANDQLVAKVRLNPRDIGHISESTRVRLGLTTFDVRRYGHIMGYVQSISPTSDLDDRGEPFFEVVVDLSQDFVEFDGLKKSLQSGMEVSAEFRLEERTLLEYFTSPIQTALSTAFTERQ